MLSSAACANPPREVDPGPISSTTLDFDAPLGALGVRTNDLASVPLPFVPVEPEIGTGHVSYVAIAPDAPEASMVGLVYEDPAWGRLIVQEYLDTQSQADLLAWEEQLVDEGCVGGSCRFDPFTQVDLGGGVVALVGSSPDVQDPALTSVEWIQPLEPADLATGLDPELHLVIDVLGYTDTLSMAEAIEFARRMVAAQI